MSSNTAHYLRNWRDSWKFRCMSVIEDSQYCRQQICMGKRYVSTGRGWWRGLLAPVRDVIPLISLHSRRTLSNHARAGVAPKNVLVPALISSMFSCSMTPIANPRRSMTGPPLHPGCVVLDMICESRGRHIAWGSSGARRRGGNQVGHGARQFRAKLSPNRAFGRGTVGRSPDSTACL